MSNHTLSSSQSFPKGNRGFDAKDEPLVDLAEYIDGNIVISMEYFKQGIPYATNKCLLRKTAADLLEISLKRLPDGYGFKIYDAWRPIQVQQALFDRYFESLKKEYSGKAISEQQLMELAKKFVSVPSYDKLNPPAHTTGGAIDLTIIDRDGNELDMGTKFDDFTDRARTDFFEHAEDNRIRDNRRLLYDCMTFSGFTNLQSEWWHYDYGTNFWSYYKKRPAIYKGIWEGSE